MLMTQTVFMDVSIYGGIDPVIKTVLVHLVFNPLLAPSLRKDDYRQKNAYFQIFSLLVILINGISKWRYLLKDALV
jgi:hypothetical protein